MMVIVVIEVVMVIVVIVVMMVMEVKVVMMVIEVMMVIVIIEVYSGGNSGSYGNSGSDGNSGNDGVSGNDGMGGISGNDGSSGSDSNTITLYYHYYHYKYGNIVSSSSNTGIFHTFPFLIIECIWSECKTLAQLPLLTLTVQQEGQKLFVCAGVCMLKSTGGKVQRRKKCGVWCGKQKVECARLHKV